MAVHSRAKNSKNSTRITVRGTGGQKTKVPMAKANRIPPGRYQSKIVSIKNTTTAAGDAAVEVVYELTDADGCALKMREVLPVDSWAFEKFSDALIAAGMEEDDDLDGAVGVTEDVVLTYPDPKGLGHFKSRKPVAGKSNQAALTGRDDDDDEGFEDLLAYEDE